MVGGSRAWPVAAGAASCAVAFGLAVAPAQAEDLAAVSPEPAEILVTAERRAERALDVPVSLSVLGATILESARLTQADDLAARIPNLQFSATVGENTPIFALRGVSMADFSLNQAGPVATYYDEVYKGNFAFLGVQMFDLARIEVLRGPQGTLYGKNTTGGAINLIAAEPVMRNEGYVQLGLGNFGRVEANGAANLALGPTFAVRLAFTTARAEGWFRNRLPGQPDLSGTHEYGLRGIARWEPSAGARFTLVLATSLQNPSNYGVHSQPGPAGVGAGVYEAYGSGASYFRAGLGIREEAANYTPKRHARTWSVALTGQVDLPGDLALTSVTAWDKGDLFVPEDTDASPTQALEIPYTDRGTQFSQDLRLSSTGTGPLKAILGAYFHREALFNSTLMHFWTDLDVDGNGRVDAQDCAANPAFLACVVGNRFDQVKHSYALYGDLHYAVAEGTTLRGGLRFTRDDGAQRGLLAELRGVDGVLVATLIPPTDRRFRTSNISGKIGIDQRLGASGMAFASYSRGYRGSGFNAQAYFSVSEANVARPELIDAFEVGVKARTADRRLSLAATGFWYIYHNQQFLSVNPANAEQNLVNLDRSRSYGAEFELDARPLDPLSLHLGLGLLDARAQRGTISGNAVRGRRLSNAPAITLNAMAELRAWHSATAELTLRGTVSAVSAQYFEILNIPRLRQPGYALLGAGADYESGPWTFSLWAKNLGDRAYFTARIDLSGFGFDYNHVGTPRTWGGSIRYRY